MTRSVYVTGIGRGDGRQVVELGVMELLTRTVDRVGVFVPLRHPGPDHLFDLLRARYRLTQDPATARGLEYAEAAALEAGHGTDELVSRLVDRYQAVAAEHEVVLVLGSDYRDTQLPAELDLNARLANEFGAPVLPVVGGRRQSAASVADEVHNTYRAFSALGCDIEWRNPELACPKVAERLFAPDEYEALCALPPDQWVAGFFNCWTRKEAYVKALGLGLSYPLDAFTVSVAPGEPACFTSDEKGWTLTSFEPMPGYQAALVLR